MLCEVQKDFRLRGKAKGASDEGSSVRVDGDKGALLPVADAKDSLRCCLLRSIGSGQNGDKRFRRIMERAI